MRCLAAEAQIGQSVDDGVNRVDGGLDEIGLSGSILMLCGTVTMPHVLASSTPPGVDISTYQDR